ncbi:MAG: lysophospholipid acyltransferase family protein [Armatimonadetes bacterium]|nr:lysophospholipid acyltransferase family protein [Armatimonadota bacterium]
MSSNGPNEYSFRRRAVSERRKRIEKRLTGWLAVAAAWLVRSLPLRWVQMIGDAFGQLIFTLIPSRQKMADRNLRAVFGDRLTPRQRHLIRNFSTRNITKTTLEMLKLPAMSAREFAALVVVRNPEYLDEAVATGRGVILLTAHFGNWEVIARVLLERGYFLCSVAREADDPRTETIITQSRESTGQRIIGRSDVRSMMRVLHDGGILGILPDQHAKRGGIVVDFLGRPASTFPGPAVMALRTGAVILPAFGRRTEDNRIVCQFRCPVTLPETGDRDADVVAGTQLVNDIIGREIMKRPAQWLWLHDRWRPEDRRELDPNWVPPRRTAEATSRPTSR